MRTRIRRLVQSTARSAGNDEENLFDGALLVGLTIAKLKQPVNGKRGFTEKFGKFSGAVSKNVFLRPDQLLR
jgi:hypothetical protein